MEENSFLISVIIPMFNSAGTIINALNSVKLQTFKCCYEIIVVNDGSSDGCNELVENYKFDDDRFKLMLINQENGGVSKARNTGLKNAQGDYIAFLDADDYWVDNKIQKQVFYLEDGFDFVCGLRNNEKITFPYTMINGYAPITLNKLLIKVVGQTSTAIFKNSVIKNSGFFDENQRYSEDANLWMKISKNNKMIILNEVLVLTENDYGNTGLSSNLIEMEKGVRKNIKEMYSLSRINFLQYIFFSFISYLKYLRRTYL